jgi:hypothetical protein
MKSRQIPMTPDEFHRLERELGWKYEYWDGCAQISPSSALMRCSRPVGDIESTRLIVQVEPVMPSDAQALTQAYVAAFGGGVEYCDWPEEKMREDASTSVEGFFSGRGGAPLTASRLVRDHADPSAPVIGALLVVETGVGVALMDLLFVVPGRLRQGLASAMAASALVALKETGFQALESRYLLANQASRAWHHRMGFVDQPDFMSARAMLAHARHILERHQIQGGSYSATLTQVKTEIAHWEAEVERLDAEEERRWRARHRPDDEAPGGLRPSPQGGGRGLRE